MTLFMAVVTMPLLTSCGEDDKEGNGGNGNGGDTTGITGAYTGKINVMNLGEGPNDVVAVLARTGDKYSLLLKDLNVDLGVIVGAPGAIAIPDVTIPNVTFGNGILGGGDTQSIPVTLPDFLAEGFGGITEIEVEVIFNNGAVSGNNLTFNLGIALPTEEPWVIPVAFNGNK